MPPLQERSVNILSKPEIRAQVVALRREGWTFGAIAVAEDIPKSTARDIVSRWNQRGHNNDASRSGRPKKLSKRDIRRLSHQLRIDPFQTLDEIRVATDTNTSTRLIGQALRDINYYLRIPRKKPFLSPKMKQKRLQWCKDREHWSTLDWRNWIYTDECQVILGHGGRPPRVRRRPNTAFDEGNLMPIFKQQSTSAMFWAAITWDRSNGRTSLVLIRKREPRERTSPRDRLGMNSAQYTNEVLTPYLLPFWNRIYGSMGGMEVLEDGSGPHNGPAARQFRLEHGIPRAAWPGNLPDLNPIENCWRELKIRLRKRFKDVNKRPQNQQELIAAAQEEWLQIDQKWINHLIDSMPLRIAAVIKARGGHTRW